MADFEVTGAFNLGVITEALNDLVSKVQEATAKINQNFASIVEGSESVAESFNMVNKAAGNVEPATAGLGRLSSSIAYVTARLAAYEAGLGPIGFALGSLARNATELAPLLAVAFPVVGAVALIMVISQLMDKIDAINEKARKTAVEFDNLATSSIHSADAMELQSLKLEDQINKFEGRPTANRLQEALIENKMKADELAKSLQAAIEKSLELMKSGEVGFWGSLLTGKAMTSDLRSSLKDATEDLEAARAASRAIMNTGTEEEKKAAQTRVNNARDALMQILLDKKSQLEEMKKAEQESIPGVEVEGVAPTGGMEEEEVNKKYRERSAIINDMISLLKSQTIEESNLARLQADAIAEKAFADAAEAKAREKALAMPDIKNAEESANQRLNIQRKLAEDTFHLAESSIRLQADKEVEGGKDRAQADLDANAQILTARRALNTALITAEDKHFTAMSDALTKQAELIRDTEVDPNRAADLKTIDGVIERQKEAHIARINSLIDEGVIAENAIETQAAGDRVEIRDKANAAMVEGVRATTRLLLDSTKNTASDELATVRATAEEKLRTVQANESLHLITAMQAKDQRIAVLEEERKAINDVLEAEKATLEIQQTLVLAAERGLPESSTALKELRSTYDSLTKAINDVNSAQSKLNTQIGKAETDAQITALKNLEKQYQATFMRVGDVFSSAFDNMLFHGQSFFQSMGRGIIQVEEMFIQSLFRMLAHHIAVEATKVMVKLGSESAQTAAHATSEAAQTAATAAGESERQEISLMGALKQIIHAAAVAAGKAWSALADIPVVGPVLGAIAAAATFAGVMAFGAIAGSAQKGALLSEDMPIFAHAKEMILPADISTGLKAMISSTPMVTRSPALALGGGGMVGGGVTNLNTTLRMGDIHAIDSVGMAEQLRRARIPLARTVESAIRSGHLGPKGVLK
jgi:hypothetical protein